MLPAQGVSILFCRDKNPEREIWEGFHYGPEAARTTFGFDQAYAITSLDQRLPDLLADHATLHYTLGKQPALDSRVLGWLDVVRSRARIGVTAPSSISDVSLVTAEMRLIKDAT